MQLDIGTGLLRITAVPYKIKVPNDSNTGSFKKI